MKIEKRVLLSLSSLFSLVVFFTEESDEMKQVKFRFWWGSSDYALSFQWSVGFWLRRCTYSLKVNGRLMAPRRTVPSCWRRLLSWSYFRWSTLSAYVLFFLLSLDLRFDCFELKSVAFNWSLNLSRERWCGLSMGGGSDGLWFKSEAVEDYALCSVVRLLEEISI